MVVAREKYDYLQPQEQKQTKTIKKQKPKKNYRFQKVLLCTNIVAILALSLVLLLRFATITEARHQVHTLNSQLDQLKMQKEHLKVKVESASKSKWIEKEAIERLSMQYPLLEQMLYIHVSPQETAMLTREMRVHNNEVFDEEISKKNSILNMAAKIVGLFKI